MWCHVAWADGVIYDDERERMMSLFERIADGAVQRAEIERWLESGPPPLSGEVGVEATAVFVEEAIALARSDGEFASLEVRAIERLAGVEVERGDGEDPGLS